MDRGAWWSMVHRVVKSQPRLKQFSMHAEDLGSIPLGQGDRLEKEMATHSSILAWKIPWTEEPAGLQSMGSQRIRHD